VLDFRAAIHHHRDAAGMRDSSRLEVDDPELQPEAPRTRRHRLYHVGDAELGSPKDVDDVDRSRRGHGLRERRVAAQTRDRGLAGIHRHHLVADGGEVAQHAIGGSGWIGRRPYDRDPVRGAEERLNRVVVEERDVEAALLGVEDVANPRPIRGVVKEADLESGVLAVRNLAVATVLGQVRASFAYGWPSAAGATEWPMNPASTTIVTM
jgi:hypothetical protein